MSTNRLSPTYDGDADIHRALSAGACAYLIKDALVEQLVAAIRAAAAGKRVIPAPVAVRLAEFTPRADLTAREVMLRHPWAPALIGSRTTIPAGLYGYYDEILATLLKPYGEAEATQKILQELIRA